VGGIIGYIYEFVIALFISVLDTDRDLRLFSSLLLIPMVRANDL